MSLNPLALLMMGMDNVMRDTASAPTDNEEWLAWANEIVPFGGELVRRCVWHMAVVGPAMAYVLFVRDGVPPNESNWQYMLEKSKVMENLCSVYLPDGTETDFEGWITAMSQQDGPVYVAERPNYQAHAEYIGLDVRTPDQMLEDEPLPVFAVTLTDGEGEPITSVPSRYASTVEQATDVAEAWLKELTGE